VSDTIQPLPPVPDGIREAAQRGILVPFIGAGVSKLAGCPDWKGFADGALLDIIHQGKLSHSQLDQISHLGPRVKLSLARAFEEEYGVSIDFRKLLHPVDRHSHSAGRRLYSGLSRFAKTFVTTNYDEWLDDEIPEPVLSVTEGEAVPEAPQDRRRTIVHRVQDLTPAVLDQPGTVVHLHGSLLEPGGMILTTRGYVRHYANDRSARDPQDENRILTFLGYLFDQKRVLFIGYSCVTGTPPSRAGGAQSDHRHRERRPRRCGSRSGHGWRHGRGGSAA
jgi:hypothetical protein